MKEKTLLKEHNVAVRNHAAKATRRRRRILLTGFFFVDEKAKK